MIPPRRHRHSRWHCAICGVELGRLHRAHHGAQVLYPTGLKAAEKTGERQWNLTCSAGHVTAWQGDRITWDETPMAA